MLRRETLIALRARHTAFRIAVGVMFPRIDAQPTTPAVHLPEDFREEDPKVVRKRERLARRIEEGIVVVPDWIVWVLLALGINLLCIGVVYFFF